MKLTATIAAAALALVCAAPAQAHTMTKRQAANEAWLALNDAAEAREQVGETLTDVDLNRRDCNRRSRHRFVCVGSVTYELLDCRACIPRRCTANVNVRYRSPRSFVVLTRVYGWSCL